jgi:hypothetical protein
MWYGWGSDHGFFGYERGTCQETRALDRLDKIRVYSDNKDFRVSVDGLWGSSGYHRRILGRSMQPLLAR